LVNRSAANWQRESLQKSLTLTAESGERAAVDVAASLYSEADRKVIEFNIRDIGPQTFGRATAAKPGGRREAQKHLDENQQAPEMLGQIRGGTDRAVAFT
jgi:hypothetical protein